MSRDAATETCKWGFPKHRQLFVGRTSPNLPAKELFLQFLPGFGSVLLSERSSCAFASRRVVQRRRIWERRRLNVRRAGVSQRK